MLEFRYRGFLMRRSWVIAAVLPRNRGCLLRRIRERGNRSARGPRSGVHRWGGPHHDHRCAAFPTGKHAGSHHRRSAENHRGGHDDHDHNGPPIVIPPSNWTRW